MASLRGNVPELLKASSHPLIHLIFGIGRYFDSSFTREETMTQTDLVAWPGETGKELNSHPGLSMVPPDPVEVRETRIP